MAESEVIRLSRQLLLEQAEGERDRAVAAAENERVRADRSDRRAVMIAIAGIVATLIAGALPLMCSSKPSPAAVNEVKVYPAPQPAPIVNVQVLPAPVVVQPAIGAKK